VAIERRRSHGSVTHGRKRLDAEEECVGERARPHIGNATWRREIEQGEDDIDREFQSGERERESLPAQFDRDMIGIAEGVARGAALDEFNSAGADEHCRIAFLALFSRWHDALQAGDLRFCGAAAPIFNAGPVAGSIFAHTVNRAKMFPSITMHHTGLAKKVCSAATFLLCWQFLNNASRSVTAKFEKVDYMDQCTIIAGPLAARSENAP